MGVEIPLGGSALTHRLRAAGTARERRALLVEAGASEPVAGFLAEVEDGPPGWADRALAALGGPTVGDPVRGARAVGGALGGATPLRTAGLGGPGVIEALVELAGSSDWASRLLSARPDLAVDLCRDPRAAGGAIPQPREARYPELVAEIVRATADDTEHFDAELRRLRNREALAIALRELRGADVRETAAELADLASACLEGALAHHLPKLEAKEGRLDPPCRLVVLGLGKLGGRELNFSSDIDVLYLYEHDEGGTGRLTCHEFHVRLFERVTSSLSRVTEDGRVFRVDIDLRPEGRTGALCNSLASLERYYETWGRTWERAAWIKARPVAGDLDLFDEVRRFARPFVYRSTRDLAAVEGVVQMKAQIDAQRRRAAIGKDAFDLKLGRGGIREIEFFCQGQQLLFGGRDPRLRAANTLDALRALEAAGHLKPRVRERLADAYMLFRRVEHRIQLVEDRQTHALPSGAALEPIARSLGFSGGEALKTVLRSHTDEVHALFSGLLGAVEDEPPPPAEVEALLDPDRDLDEKHDVLVALGSCAPHTALANLATLARLPRSPFHPAASESGTRLARQLLAECLESPDLDRALNHLPELVRALLTHGAYLEQLERSDLRRGVIRVLGSSDLLARILVANPALVPSVLLAGDLPSPEAVRTGIEDRVDTSDVEGALAGLRVEKQEEILRIAIADLAGAIEPAQVQDRLTDLAESVIDACLRLALAEAEKRFGPPQDPDTALVLLAGGTLGSRELGYRSDVDLSAIYVGGGETRSGRRSPVSVAEFYTRVVQRTLSFLTLRMAQGDLYPVDMRLRPSGSQGALVASLESFETYHREGRAQLWERQALVRTRVLLGPPALRVRVEQALFAATFGPGHRPRDAAEIHAMRIRMERGRSRGLSTDRLVDLKLGPGGLVEAEFLVQHLVLLHAPSRPEIAHTRTREALLALAGAGFLPPRTARRVAQAHLRIRRVVDWLRVIHDETLNVLDLSAPSLRPVALALGYEGQDAQERLRLDLESDREAIRRAYTTWVEAHAED